MTEIKEIDTIPDEPTADRPENRRKKRQTTPFLKPRDGLLIAFFVPVLVMICIFVQRGIFPFGERCFLRTDMYHQYAPFFLSSSISCGPAEVSLQLGCGMGVNFAALYAYYPSPLNWLILLCPKKFIIEFMTIMIVLKIDFGLSCRVFKETQQNCILGVGFFGILCLSGYMAAYSWNIMAGLHSSVTDRIRP
ncbi:MAG: YfhO family protein [Pilosibacter sp.]